MYPIIPYKDCIKAIKEGHTKAEAAHMHGLNIDTVYNFTRGIEGHRLQGNHIISIFIFSHMSSIYTKIIYI